MRPQESSYYWEAVREDIVRWLDDHEEEIMHLSEDDIRDELLMADDVTGNASGSYWMNSAKAYDCVIKDLEAVATAYWEMSSADQLIYDMSRGFWESMDVVARCWTVFDAFADVVEEREQDSEDDDDWEDDDEQESDDGTETDY